MIKTSSKGFSRGFTLIELLVVIAIIGILTSVVLASLNSARLKGGDVSVKANLSTVRAQAEVYYDGTGVSSYGSADHPYGVCAWTADTLFADPVIKSAILKAKTDGGNVVNCSYAKSTGTWAVWAALKSVTTEFWCVDNSGNSGKSTLTSGSKCQ